VTGLLLIIEDVIDRELENLHKNNVRLVHLGRKTGLNEHLQRKIAHAVNLTQQNTGLTLNIAFNYGGRDEVVYAIQSIIRLGVPAEAVTEALVSAHLFTAGQPDPDLVVRTSGEMRISNFLIWQSSYAEWYVTPRYWPDFDREALRQAVWFYADRERRFGKISEQVKR
jgi:undecaprenyl diphosphate synthase